MSATDICCRQDSQKHWSSGHRPQATRFGIAVPRRVIEPPQCHIRDTECLVRVRRDAEQALAGVRVAQTHAPRRRVAEGVLANAAVLFRSPRGQSRRIELGRQRHAGLLRRLREAGHRVAPAQPVGRRGVKTGCTEMLVSRLKCQTAGRGEDTRRRARPHAQACRCAVKQRHGDGRETQLASDAIQKRIAPLLFDVPQIGSVGHAQHGGTLGNTRTALL
jgi:hypothetical protein